MISTTDISQKLDSAEASLPPIPAKTLAFGRATARRTTSVTSSVIGEVTERVGNVAEVMTSAARTATGQARSAAGRSATALRNGVAEATGQAAAQANRTVDAIESETTGLLDDATHAVDPAPHNPQSLSALTKSELYERAQDRDISGRAAMSKAQLIAALRS